MRLIAQGSQGAICLGITPERGAAWLPFIIPEFIAHHPSVKLRLSEGIDGDLLKQLTDRTCDLCVVSMPPITPELHYVPEMKSPIYLISAASHPFASDIDLTRNSLKHLITFCPSVSRGKSS